MENKSDCLFCQVLGVQKIFEFLLNQNYDFVKLVELMNFFNNYLLSNKSEYQLVYLVDDNYFKILKVNNAKSK